MKLAAFFISTMISTMSFGNCDSKDALFSKDGFEVKTLNYFPAEKSDKVVIIVPPTGGTNFLDRRYAGALCKKGFAVYILSHWTDDDEVEYDLRIHQRLYDRAQKAISLLVENIDAKFIGILGTSVGGIHISMAMTHIKNIDAAFVIAAGAPVASIIAETDQMVLVRAKEKRFKMFGFKSEHEYETALKKAIHWDQTKVINRAHKTLGMIILEEDTMVPSKYQHELEAAWKPETKFSLDRGHINGIVWTWLFHSDKVTDFFVRAAQAKNQSSLLR